MQYGRDRATAALLLVLALGSPTALAAPPPVPTPLRQAHARYLAATGRPRAALRQLRHYHADYNLLAARLYLQRGLTAAAGRALTDYTGNPGANDQWLALAQARYDRGDRAGAQQALLAMQPETTPAQGLQRASLMTRLRLQQDKPQEAVLALAGERRRQELPAADAYNLALAWIRAGDTDNGALLLDKLGSYIGGDLERKAVADQANVTLGYWLLDRNLGNYAKRAFLNVRLHSPLARKALLGLGWAEISAGGLLDALIASTPDPCTAPNPDLWADADPLDKVPRSGCRLRAVKKDKRLLDAAALRTTVASQYRRAAVAWRAAAQNADPGNPVVAEARTAIPFALAKAGDQAAAVRGFNATIAALGSARATLTKPPRATVPIAGTPLARVVVELDRARADLQTLAQRLAPANTAAPAATRRGRLLVVAPQLAGGDGAALTPGQRRTLRKSVDRLQARARKLAAAVDKTARTGAMARRASRREMLGKYLIQARIGLAAIRR